MIRHLAGASLTIALVVLASGCATTAGTTSTPAAGASAGAGAHDMPGMVHDMSAPAASRNAEIAFLFPGGDDKGWSKVENGSGHSAAPDIPLAQLPTEQRSQLLRQLALTMDVVKKYPTVRDAEAAGYRRAGPFLPGLGTHYVGGRNNRSGTLTDEDIARPSTIIYDGTAADSPIAGFMYISMAVGGGAQQPEGFAGPNDHWHYHTGICLVAGANGSMEALGFDGSITEADCRTKRGNFVATTQYLLHVWTVPGYTNSLGVFAHVNPALTCSDGTYHMDDHDITNACRKR